MALAGTLAAAKVILSTIGVALFLAKEGPAQLPLFYVLLAAGAILLSAASSGVIDRVPRIALGQVAFLGTLLGAAALRVPIALDLPGGVLSAAGERAHLRDRPRHRVLGGGRRLSRHDRAEARHAADLHGARGRRGRRRRAREPAVAVRAGRGPAPRPAGPRPARGGSVRASPGGGCRSWTRPVTPSRTARGRSSTCACCPG